MRCRLAVFSLLAAAELRSQAKLPVHGSTGNNNNSGGGRGSLVVTYHPEATEAGEKILRAGGNAFDAFVAATFAEYVVAEGGTSMAGPLGVLVFDAANKRVEYLDADYNEVRDSGGRFGTWDGLLHWAGFDRSGKTVLVPGAVAGLEALSKRYGRLPLAQSLQPAIDLARGGFPLSEFYAVVLAWSEKTLKKSDYGRKTFFFPSGSPLARGDRLRQPAVASFLTKVAQQGSSYMYRGEWARECVRSVSTQAGRLTLEDLARYRPDWRVPHRMQYRGYDLYGPGGRDWGGLWVGLALRALEHAPPLASLGHYTKSADALELVTRVIRQVWGELEWLENPAVLDNPAEVESRSSRYQGERIWKQVLEKLPARVREGRGSHSYHIVVVDKDGNVASGTNTIQSLPWGNGTFVEGVPLNQTGYLTSKSGPGERRTDALTMHFGFRDDKFRFATGAFTGSLLETDLQFVLNLIDYQLPAESAVSLPRIGSFPYDLTGKFEAEANWLDPDISAELAAQVETRGVKFKRNGPLICSGLDTGLGVVVTMSEAGKLTGARAPWPGLTAPWRDCAVATDRGKF